MFAKVIPHGLSRGYLVCAALALAAIWLHRYPPGIDLPQHANLFQILANYSDPDTAYAFFYDRDFFTPYAILYLLGWFFAEIGGALFAVKMVLSIAVLATPLAMTKWLRAIGATPSLGVLGFVVAFGYGFYWGFLSFVLSLPIAYSYLASLAELRERQSLRQQLILASSAIVLFFCHGITFGVTMLAGGLICVIQRDIRRMFVECLHFIPCTLVFGLWFYQHAGSAAGGVDEWPTAERFGTLFAGAFSSSADYYPALAGFLVAAIFVIIGRPVLSRSPMRIVPFALSILGLLALPETVGDTWLVGSRFVQFVWAYFPGALVFPTQTRTARRVQIAALAITSMALVSLHLRLRVFNRELAGLRRLEKYVRAGADVKLFPNQKASRAFGRSQLGQVAAWIPAKQAGFLENDSSLYFQLPVKRRSDLPWPSEYRALIARGTPKQARKAVGKRAKHVRTEADFHLFMPKLTRIHFPGISLVRWAQDWEHPRKNRSVTGRPLAIEKRTHSKGIGTHARSVLQLHLDSGTKTLRGAAGVDDGAKDDLLFLFRIWDTNRRELWTSPLMKRGEPPAPFEVDVTRLRGDVFLTADTLGDDRERAYGNWIDLEARP